MNHLLSIEKLPLRDMKQILENTAMFKRERGSRTLLPLKGQTWGMIFAKSSTRTRVSFEVGIHELGGNALFLSANDIQLGRGELIKDTARVLGRMTHGCVIRTFKQQDVEDFAQYSGIPTVNALTDWEHPCQILTDIFTVEEKMRSIQGKVVTFVGDGACNIPISWAFAAAKLGFELRIAAPKEYQLPDEVLERAGSSAKIYRTGDPKEAAKGADVLYTDTWISMGKESESAQRISLLKNYQINKELVSLANKDVMVLHCLPAYRGKEITEEIFEQFAGNIFDQAENRLHTQKAIMDWMTD
ncbi:MAG: ornithine carbamoyltransferase [Verrucomicrobia bacterium]|jgi:ornithine carbamoyltransferase|nr:ornithine carbamoyltransferase [Verrucomicrobiota bacterium]MBP5761256.1 ornithine carbamoyltransferase [Verrucomicrobiota bacterium]